MKRSNEVQNTQVTQETGDKKHRGLKAIAVLGVGALSLAGAAVMGVKGWNEGLVKNKMDIESGKSEIVDIDLELSETSHTAYTQKINAKAKMTKEVLGMDAYFKSDEVNFLAETKMTMKSNTAKARYDADKHHITAHIDADAIETNISMVPGSIQHTTDGNLAAAFTDSLAINLKAIPWLGDLSALEGVTTSSDKSNSVLGNIATVTGLNSAAETCPPKAWPVLDEAFADGIANDVLLGAKLLDPTLTRENVTVLIGDAETEVDNDKQVVGKVSSVQEAYDKMNKQLSANGVEVTSNPGTCELSDELAKKYSNEVAGQNNG